MALTLMSGVAWWAKGRGYKTALIVRFFPTSRLAMKHPTITASRPGDQEGDVAPEAYIAFDVQLPNPGKVIDKATLEDGVLLFRGNAQEKVPVSVNTSGAGDAIVIRPLQPLALKAPYTVQVLPAVRDTAGASFQYFTASFNTGSGNRYSEYPCAAEKAALPPTQLVAEPGEGAGVSRKAMPSYAGVTVGPDHRLYANTTDGRILRYEIEPDGTVGAPTLIDTIRTSAGGGKPSPRLVTGICFDPTSTASELRAWVTHSEPIGYDLHDWTGKLSLLTGPDLENCQDYVVGLPRARLDHATNQPVLGPDGALYFCQASNTAMGAFTAEWGKRGEHLLTACILRVNTAALTHPPLDVRTEGSGSYDPFAPGAPVTIYATGTRNAYDLLWHSNGHLYAPVNGSARGGNSPATPADGAFPRRYDQDQNGSYSGPAVPALHTLPTQNDFLLKVERGAYYGHPNPARAEYVLNGGNPTVGLDPYQVAQYPVGTAPDRNWHRPIFDFGKNLAPCGILEYKGDAFPQLKGKILVVSYSGGKDIAVLTPGKDGNIAEFITNLDGFTHFIDPVDLCEDPQSGYLYVAEHGGKRITLLRPVGGGISRRVVRQDTSALGVAQPYFVTTPLTTTRPAQASLETR